ncbi:hypothetical protein PL8927_290021 [Planktothrix serta PCC 8927]|uniref:Uncharacterized protein n=1 Tax=Planktothrix serta PCC 8927 TaxID=671068 RepID=A0A7Z9DXJ2_9CYAN|nr:hypothetical protein PL8927_290021 [Planktothrix serta PCC 8927]
MCKLCDRPIPELEAEIQGLVQRLHDVDPKQRTLFLSVPCFLL